jgi:hypothetical protein
MKEIQRQERLKTIIDNQFSDSTNDRNDSNGEKLVESYGVCPIFEYLSLRN